MSVADGEEVRGQMLRTSLFTETKPYRAAVLPQPENHGAQIPQWQLCSGQWRPHSPVCQADVCEEGLSVLTQDVQRVRHDLALALLREHAPRDGA